MNGSIKKEEANTLDTSVKAKRLLFVDDDESVSAGMKLSLRKYRKMWDMEFCYDGASALAEFAKQPFDIIVSDMRMPGIDGAELLTRIRDEYPGTIRILLSGQADQFSLLRALPVVHQFIAKPCEPDFLRSTLERACQLHTQLSNDRMRALITKLDKLPSLPRVYHELSAALASGQSSKSIAEIMQQDPAMSVKLLKYANSAYFGRTSKVASVDQAMVVLGVDLVRSLVLGAHVFESLAADDVLPVEQIFSHSLSTARVAKMILGNSPLAGEAFIAGLLHEVGKLAFATGMREAYIALIRESKESNKPLNELETERFGMTHGEVGAYLLSLWCLPFTIIEAVAGHHSPTIVAPAQLTVMAAVYIANTLVEQIENQPYTPLSADYLTALKVTDKVEGWRAAAEEMLRPPTS